jgi:hypothetical protein
MFCFAYWAVNGARLRATRAARYLEECLPKSEYWDVPVAGQTEETTPARLLQFLEKCG